MLPRYDYSVTVPVSVDAAFHSFQDLNRLLHRGIFEEAAWVEGKPWEVGSRLRYLVIKPIKATFSAVVNSSSPPRAISLLHHALGVTAEQHVTFSPDLKGGTRVRMMLDFVGESKELPESVIQEAITFLAQDVLDTMVALCREQSSSSATGT
jgi:hypothetical protein